MLPLSLLRTAVGHPMLVELKNGETYNGHLVNCDNFMNINLREVICTSKDGDKFWRVPKCYLRGNNIKYLRIPDEVIDMEVAEVDGVEEAVEGTRDQDVDEAEEAVVDMIRDEEGEEEAVEEDMKEEGEAEEGAEEVVVDMIRGVEEEEDTQGMMVTISMINTNTT
eukprot:Nk52_evm36s745 gene=Nk52_evmTU36s745